MFASQTRRSTLLRPTLSPEGLPLTETTFQAAVDATISEEDNDRELLLPHDRQAPAPSFWDSFRRRFQPEPIQLPISSEQRTSNTNFTSTDSQESPKKLGTIDGVFIPTWLSIWGIIVFLRLGYCIGQAGILLTLAMFLIGYTLAVMTTLSICAISTNGIVKGGGPYFMISRTLGTEFGGSLGVLIYIGNVLGSAMNIFGFLELLLYDFDVGRGVTVHWLRDGFWWRFLYGSIALAVCTGMCLLGSRPFARTAGALFAILVVTSLSVAITFLFRSGVYVDDKLVYTGWSSQTFGENLWPKFQPNPHVSQSQSVDPLSESFQSIFGIMYPACTGILAGASMSGDLRRPDRAIPTGTLYAVLVTGISYVLFTLSIGATTIRETLVLNYTYLSTVAFVPFLVTIGIYSSAIYSVIGGILTTSKILQAMARDEIIPFLAPFSRGTRDNDEPYVAIVLTWLLVQLLLTIGDLNAIIPFISLLTLLSYGIINLACFLLKLSSAPNFRPRFTYFNALTAFCGFVGCFLAMYLVSVADAALSTMFLITIWILIHFYSTPKSWGEIQQALIYHQVRKYLLRLDVRKEHVKLWRPQILLLVRDTQSSLQLIRFANALKKGSLFVIGNILKRAPFRSALTEYRKHKLSMMEFTDQWKVKAFTEIVIAPTERIGAQSLGMTCGLGGMKPNIVVMGWIHGEEDDVEFEEEERISPLDYVSIIADTLALGKSVAIARGFEALELPKEPQGILHLLTNSLFHRRGSSVATMSPKKYIDLYPFRMSDDFNTSSMVLQLGCILHMVPAWSEQQYALRVMAIVEHRSDVAPESDRVTALLQDLRIKAQVCCVSLEEFDVAGTVMAMSRQLAQSSLEVTGNLTSLVIPSRETSGVEAGSSSANATPQFNDLTSLEQHHIINSVMQKYSSPARTAVIFTSLPAPQEVGTDVGDAPPSATQEELEQKLTHLGKVSQHVRFRTSHHTVAPNSIQRLDSVTPRMSQMTVGVGGEFVQELSATSCKEYLQGLDVLTRGAGGNHSRYDKVPGTPLPPIFLVHGRGLVVTNSL